MEAALTKSPVSRTLVRSVRWLAAIGFLALLSTKECQPIFLVVFASFFLIGLKIEDFPSLANLMGKAQPFLAALVFAASLVDFFYLSNSFLLSVAHFLLCLQGLRLMALRTNRENLGSVLLSSLMILSASTLAVEWTYFALLTIFLILVIWTLMLHTLLAESSNIREQTFVWRSMIPVVRTSALAGFGTTLACCAVIFITFPRFNFQGFRGQFLQPVHKTGFTNQVDLRKSARIFTDQSVVMRVEISPKDRALWSGYIRGTTLDRFDGRTWKRTSAQSGRIFHTRGDILIPNLEEEPGPRLRQSVYLESMDAPVLFAAPRAQRITIDRPFLDVAPDGTAQRNFSDTWRIHYDVDSFLSFLDPGFQKTKRTMPGQRRSRKYQKNADIPERVQKLLKDETDAPVLAPALNAKIAALADKITGTSTDPAVIADRIEDYLRKNNKYSLDLTVYKDGEDPLEGFLFGKKTGNCELFAASMALLLRSKNIPSRMVTGFMSKEWNKRGNYYVVRMRDAHAWTEAYVESLGTWVGFDPSPRDAFEGIPNDQWLSRMNEAMDYLNLRWNRYVLSYDFEKQVAIVQGITQKSNGISVRLGKWTMKVGPLAGLVEKTKARLKALRQSRFNWVLVPLAAGVVALVVCVVFFAAWLWKKRRARNKVWFYESLVKSLEKASGVEKSENQTVDELFVLATPNLADKKEAGYLKDTYYRLRFDPMAGTTPEETIEIKAALKKLG